MIFLTLENIKKLIDDRTDELSDLLGADFDETLILFHHFHWSKDKLENSGWFTDQEKLRREAGLDPKMATKHFTIECPICFTCYIDSDYDALNCKHKLCKNCWRELINEMV